MDIYNIYVCPPGAAASRRVQFEGKKIVSNLRKEERSNRKIEQRRRTHPVFLLDSFFLGLATNGAQTASTKGIWWVMSTRVVNRSQTGAASSASTAIISANGCISDLRSSLASLPFCVDNASHADVFVQDVLSSAIAARDDINPALVDTQFQEKSYEEVRKDVAGVGAGLASFRQCG